MAEIQINTIENDIGIADSDMMLQPEMLAKLTRMLQESMKNSEQAEATLKADREILDAASR